MRTRHACLLVLTFLLAAGAHAQELRLWPEGAPGSEAWSFPETVTTTASGDRVVANVRDPTLTAFLPDPAVANANLAPDNAALADVLRFAIADTQQALTLVRRNAQDWNIDPARVGLMGFSAGGGVAIGTAMAPQGAAYPAFLVSLYGPSLMDVELPEYAPPLFIAVGNAHFNVTNGCLALFAAWKAAGKPAELHVYDQVSGGFGMNARGLPVDAWIVRLQEWLDARGITAR